MKKFLMVLVALLAMVAFVSGVVAQDKPAATEKPKVEKAKAAKADKPKAPKAMKATGAVAGYEAGKMIKVKAKDKEMEFAIAADAKVKGEIKEGAKVTVTYKKDGDKMTATNIALVPEKKPAEKKPKAEKKAEKKPEKEDEEEEEVHEEKKKGPNPLDLLPPSKLILDEWKRMYSNNDTRTVAIPWLWEHYDKEGYSCWIGNYKYNDELEKLFMTCNLVSGFLQRLEKLRKYGFGSVIILGAEPKLQITCAFLVRGTSLPQEMLECDDVEHYTWTKVDTDNAEQRETFNKFLAWDMDNYNQGKTFK